MSTRRAAAALIAAAAVAVGVWRFAALARQWRVPAYAMPGHVIAVASVALAAVVIGAVAGARTARVEITLLSIVATALLVYGFLAIFSIGLPLLVLGVLLWAVLVRRLRGGAPLSLLAAGPVLALGLATVVVLSSQLPVVSCERGGGVITATPIWLFGGSESGSGSGSSDSAIRTGTVTLGSTTFTFACDGDHLVRFG